MSDKLRADVDRKFIRRFLILSVFGFGFMIWGLYDAVVSAPKDLKRAIAYKELLAQAEAGDLTESERAETWEAKCKENGWKTSKPKSPDDAQGYIYLQWFICGSGLIVGLAFMWHYLRLVNAWVEADQDGVDSSWGQSLKFDNIKEINKSKWEKKGIAKVTYSSDAGPDKTMVFDDFKFHRETMGKILTMAEKKLGDEQIVGAVRESEKKTEADASSASGADE